MSFFEKNRTGEKDMDAPQILLVGTAHTDPHIEHKLTALLEHYQPGAVLLEYNDTRAWENEEQIQLLSRKPRTVKRALTTTARTCLKELHLPPTFEKKMVKMLKAGTYEYIAATEYCRTTETPFYLCDTRTAQDISQERMNVMSTLSIEKVNERLLYALHDTHLYNFNHPITQELLGEELINRKLCDNGFVEALSETNVRTIAIAGLYHFFGNYNNIYERIKAPNVRRMTLSQESVDEFLKQEPNW